MDGKEKRVFGACAVQPRTCMNNYNFNNSIHILGGYPFSLIHNTTTQQQSWLPSLKLWIPKSSWMVILCFCIVQILQELCIASLLGKITCIIDDFIFFCSSKEPDFLTIESPQKDGLILECKCHRHAHHE